MRSCVLIAATSPSPPLPLPPQSHLAHVGLELGWSSPQLVKGCQLLLCRLGELHFVLKEVFLLL